MASLNGTLPFLNSDDPSRSILVIVEDMEITQSAYDKMVSSEPDGTAVFGVTIKKTEDGQGRTDRRAVLTEL